MRLERHLNLLSLPVLPEDHDGAAATDFVQDAYQAELGSLGNGKDVRAFVKRWRPLWLLRAGWRLRSDHPLRKKKLVPGERCLLTGNYDAKKVFWFLNNREQLKIRLHERDASVAINLILPYSLLESFLLANKFQVGTDLGLIRIYLDTYNVRLAHSP